MRVAIEVQGAATFLSPSENQAQSALTFCVAVLYGIASLWVWRCALWDYGDRNAFGDLR